MASRNAFVVRTGSNEPSWSAARSPASQRSTAASQRSTVVTGFARRPPEATSPDVDVDAAPRSVTHMQVAARVRGPRGPRRRRPLRRPCARGRRVRGRCVPRHERRDRGRRRAQRRRCHQRALRARSAAERLEGARERGPRADLAAAVSGNGGLPDRRAAASRIPDVLGEQRLVVLARDEPQWRAVDQQQRRCRHVRAGTRQRRGLEVPEPRRLEPVPADGTRVRRRSCSRRPARHVTARDQAGRVRRRQRAANGRAERRYRPEDATHHTEHDRGSRRKRCIDHQHDRRARRPDGANHQSNERGASTTSNDKRALAGTDLSSTQDSSGIPIGTIVGAALSAALAAAAALVAYRRARAA